MPAVTILAAKHHLPLASTKLYCSVTEAVCEQLAQRRYEKCELNLRLRDRKSPAATITPHVKPRQSAHRLRQSAGADTKWEGKMSGGIVCGWRDVGGNSGIFRANVQDRKCPR